MDTLARILALLPAVALAACGGGDAVSRDAVDDGGAPNEAVHLERLQLPEAGRYYHGVFPASAPPVPPDAISKAALDGYVAATRREVAWVYFDHEWMFSRAFPGATATWIRERGSVPFIRLMLRSQKEPLFVDPVFTLDRINAGEFDADLAAWADAAREFGTPLIVEYGTEINGDWNPWSAYYNGGLDVAPEKFRRAYRRIVELMRARGATNITWALHYNSENWPGTDRRNVPRAYYPGDDVVDWIGISAYGSERSNDERCPTFRSLVDASFEQIRAATTTKPLFVFEFGATNNNAGCAAAPWVEAAFTDMLGGRWPELRGFAWWQQKVVLDPAVGGSSNFIVQDDPAVMAVFQEALSAPGVVDRPLLP